MKLNKVHVAVVAALTGASGLLAQSAFAQQGGLEEIVVTATRRAENLQEVPISIVAITGDNLEMRGLDSLEQVSQGVPNVVITGGGGGTGWHSRTSRNALPRSVGELRPGCEWTARKLIWVRRPARGLAAGNSYGVQVRVDGRR